MILLVTCFVFHIIPVLSKILGPVYTEHQRQCCDVASEYHPDSIT